MAALLAAGASSGIAACSTIESVSFGDGDCIGAACQQGGTTTTTTTGSGGSGGGTTSSTTTMCTVNMNCTVKWGADIFNTIIDVSTSGCTSMLCHGSGQGNITIETGKPHEAYLALKDLMLVTTPPQKYIIPCDTAGSGMLCNTKLAPGETNPNGECGSLMPKSGGTLTMAQLKTFSDWIACGAPEN